MFRRPNRVYNDYYEEARFQLTWRLNFVLSILLTLISLMFVYVRPFFALHYGLGALISIAALYLLKKNKKYQASAIALTIVGFTVVISSVFLVAGIPHYIEPFWMTNIVLYAFFTLGDKWGFGMLIAEIVSILVFFLFFFQDSVSNVGSFEMSRLVMMGIEACASLALMGYIIMQFIKVNKLAERQLVEANHELIEEKQVVETQNKEKTVLLQEIHHRVKNNLQVIVSLLRLQSSKVDEGEAKEFFQDAINRVMTMALVHQKMYESESLSNIDLKDYFAELLDKLVNSRSDLNVEAKLEIGVDILGSKTIIPVALILNELVTNSLKHAFSNGASHEIGIRMSSIDNERMSLEYYDNGIWKENTTANSLGVELIEAFTNQLDGNYDRSFDNNRTTYLFELQKLED